MRFTVTISVLRAVQCIGAKTSHDHVVSTQYQKASFYNMHFNKIYMLTCAFIVK